MQPLLHFSEDPDITVFRPHVAATTTVKDAVVWVVDEAHAPGFWFPRDCPRACCWSVGKPLTELGRNLLRMGAIDRMHAIESGWLERMRACKLYVYRFDPAPFTTHEVPEAGYFTTRETVVPLCVEPVGDLLARHAAANIELRIVPDFWPVRDAIVASGLEFSIIRQRNALPRRP
jgi:hypothetical protein